MLHNLNHLGIVVAGCFYRINVRFVDMTPLPSNVRSEIHGYICFRIIRSATTIGSNFSIVELGKVLRQVRVCGKTVETRSAADHDQSQGSCFGAASAHAVPPPRWCKLS